MGKYEPLAQYLAERGDDSWEARFSDIERVLGFPLPRSAREYPAWWANQDGSHSQTKGWRDAGWETSNVDLPARRVRFVRRKKTGRAASENSDGESLEALVKRAGKLTGLGSRDDVLRHALEVTIRHEAAKALIALGGSDPDAKAPPRRRFW